MLENNAQYLQLEYNKVLGKKATSEMAGALFPVYNESL